jgi:hypothetical protein
MYVATLNFDHAKGQDSVIGSARSTALINRVTKASRSLIKVIGKCDACDRLTELQLFAKQ